MRALRSYTCRPLLRPSQHSKLAQRRSSNIVRAPKASTHWNKEKLVTTERYPLSQEVSKKAGKGLGENVRARRIDSIQKLSSSFARTQVVNPQLCDDVLKYIGHTLDKHKGCDIIDINPGAGLWSTKLHEYLQPRRHILLEPAMDKYGHFLQPLLDAPNSKYHLVTKDPCRFAAFDELIEEGFLPDQKVPTQGDPASRQLNNSLLVTGSVMWEPTLPGYGYSSMAKQFMFQQAQFAWRREYFHKFGPVRMLLWAQTDDLRSLLPRGTTHMGKTDMFTKMLCNVTEVVQPEPRPKMQGSDLDGREPRYNIESMIKALKRGKNNGIEYPVHRRTNWHEIAEDIATMTDGTGQIDCARCEEYLLKREKAGKSTLGVLSERSRNSLALEEKFLKEPEQWLDTTKLSTNRLVKANGQKFPWNAEGKLLRNNMAQIKEVLKKRIEIDRICGVLEQSHLLECKIVGMPDGTEKDDALEMVKRYDAQYDAAYDSMAHNWQERIVSDMDDRCSIRYPGVMLQWDKRPYEPLVAQKDEVWPAAYVSLGDFHPLPIPDDFDEQQQEYLNDFAAGLLAFRNVRLDYALENMDHGSSELIDQVPSLKDPLEGGRLDPKKLRGRMLTLDMIYDLHKAYREWPFREESSQHPRHFQLKLRKSLTGGIPGPGMSVL